jgi:hypothetical protein
VRKEREREDDGTNKRENNKGEGREGDESTKVITDMKN